MHSEFPPSCTKWTFVWKYDWYHSEKKEWEETTFYLRARKQFNGNGTSHVGSWYTARYKIFWLPVWLNELISPCLGHDFLQSLAKFWTTWSQPSLSAMMCIQTKTKTRGISINRVGSHSTILRRKTSYSGSVRSHGDMRNLDKPMHSRSGDSFPCTLEEDS